MVVLLCYWTREVTTGVGENVRWIGTAGIYENYVSLTNVNGDRTNLIDQLFKSKLQIQID